MTVDVTEIRTKIIRLTAETLQVEESKIAPESHFAEDLGADSLDTVELIMAMEAAFDCNIPDSDARKIATINQAVEYVMQTKKSALDKNTKSA